MGWLFGKKNDGLYRGDAPATAPGYDSAEPTAYTGTVGAAPYTGASTVSANPYPTASAPYPTATTPFPTTPFPTTQFPTAPSQYPGAPTATSGFSYPAGGTPYPSAGQRPTAQQPYVQPGSTPSLGQIFGAAGTGMSAGGVPPELAAALRFARNQQRVVTRTVTRSIFGFLLPMLLIGGLVAVGYFVVGKVQDGIDNPFRSSGSAPGEPVQGVVGTAGSVALGDNTYDITISSATAQPTPAFGSFLPSTSGGFLVIELSLTRTDSTVEVSQISWFDWMFTPESGAAQEGELIAGGYEPLLSTLNLQPGESATGLVAFDTTSSVGTLSLTNNDGTWAQWPIDATVPTVVAGAFGVPLHPEAGGTPFTVTVANPRWIGTGDPATWIDPSSGTYLVLDVAVALDEGGLGATSSLSLGFDTWQFVPDGGTAVSSYIGVTGADGITFSAGEPTTVNTLIAFDTPRSAGTVNLVNVDGSVLASWGLPAL